MDCSPEPHDASITFSTLYPSKNFLKFDASFRIIPSQSRCNHGRASEAPQHAAWTVLGRCRHLEHVVVVRETIVVIVRLNVHLAETPIRSDQPRWGLLPTSKACTSAPFIDNPGDAPHENSPPRKRTVRLRLTLRVAP